MDRGTLAFQVSSLLTFIELFMYVNFVLRWTMIFWELHFPGWEEKSSFQLCRLCGVTVRWAETLLSFFFFFLLNFYHWCDRSHWPTWTATTLTGNCPPPNTFEDLKHENLLWSEWTLIRNQLFQYCNYHKLNIGQMTSSVIQLPSIVLVWLASIVWHVLVALKICMTLECVCPMIEFAHWVAESNEQPNARCLSLLIWAQY